MIDLKGFAEKNAFKIRIAAVRPDGEHFSVAMERRDFIVSAVNSFDTNVFRLAFYTNETDSAEGVDTVIDALKRTLGGVPGITLLPTSKPSAASGRGESRDNPRRLMAVPDFLTPA